MKWKLLPALIVVTLLFAGHGSGEIINFNGLYWQVGPDKNMTWDQAKAWVDALGGDWRMPTRAELRGLWDAGINSNNWGEFVNSGGWVWSGEVRDSSYAWLFDFYIGNEGWGNRNCFENEGCVIRNSYGRVFALDDPITEYHICPYCNESFRSQSAIDSHIVAEQRLQLITVSGEIITDSHTGLQWRVAPDRDTDWNEANSWVDGLGGNWRMPTRAELQDLWNAGISRHNWGPFENSGWLVWSGEVIGSSSAMSFSFFSQGSAHWYDRSRSLRRRAFAVRPQ